MPIAAGIEIAAKCAPEEEKFSAIERAGLRAVELYLSGDILAKTSAIIRSCRKFPFRYALHAPNDSYDPFGLARLARGVKAEAVTFHNIYWEEEWDKVAKIFRGVGAKICIENTYSVHEPQKFIRRYGFNRCLDLEHLQMECAGVYEGEFLPVIRQAAHIHLTGYTFGSKDWHTHIHHAGRQSIRMLDLLKQAGYNGLVVSEAKCELQTFGEFKKLSDFFASWRKRE